MRPLDVVADDEQPAGPVALRGFPAVAADGSTIAIGDFEEYRDLFVTLWSIAGDRELRRTILKPTGQGARQAARLQHELDTSGYRTMREIVVQKAAGPLTSCEAHAVCVSYDVANGVASIRSASSSRELALPRRRLLAANDAGRCLPYAKPQAPIGLRAFFDATSRVWLLRWQYLAHDHGCELPLGYRAVRL